MKLVIAKETAVRVPVKLLDAVTRVACTKTGRRENGGLVTLVFTRDRQIRTLNLRHRRKNKATDVLSFPLDTPLEGGTHVGEVYISIDTARRQADEYRLAFSHELARLYCHGLLHLFGYDHDRPATERVMRAKEALILEQVLPGVWEW